MNLGEASSVVASDASSRQPAIQSPSEDHTYSMMNPATAMDLIGQLKAECPMTKCIFNCPNKITYVEQCNFYLEYARLPTRKEQQGFIRNHIIRKGCKTHKASTALFPRGLRIAQNSYHIPNSAGQLVKVCKSFFRSTLAVSDYFIDKSVKWTKNVDSTTPLSPLLLPPSLPPPLRPAPL